MNDGGPAFPSHGSMGEVAHEGMTLRDYFAAKALILCADERVSSAEHASGVRWPVKVALAAFEIADAMLEARK